MSICLLIQRSGHSRLHSNNNHLSHTLCNYIAMTIILINKIFIYWKEKCVLRNSARRRLFFSCIKIQIKTFFNKMRNVLINIRKTNYNEIQLSNPMLNHCQIKSLKDKSTGFSLSVRYRFFLFMLEIKFQMFVIPCFSCLSPNNWQPVRNDEK